MTCESGVVGASQGKRHFSQLLERVAAGEEITITRHGVPVARLVPVIGKSSGECRRDAIAQMRELAARNTLSGLGVKDLIVEGRR